MSTCTITRWLAIGCTVVWGLAGPAETQARMAAPTSTPAGVGWALPTTLSAAAGFSHGTAPRARQQQRTSAPRKKRGSSTASSAAMQRARRAIRSGDLELAETLVRSMSKTTNLAERNAWAIVEAELAYARKRYARAGLVAMRIVILHPKSQQVGAAFFWAARAYEGLRRPGKAIELYQSCARHKTTPRSIRDKAQKQLAKLRAQVTTP